MSDTVKAHRTNVVDRSERCERAADCVGNFDDDGMRHISGIIPPESAPCLFDSSEPNPTANPRKPRGGDPSDGADQRNADAFARVVARAAAPQHGEQWVDDLPQPQDEHRCVPRPNAQTFPKRGSQ